MGRPWHERAFRVLLRMFPREFRGDFGHAMAEDFRDQIDDAARARGRGGVMRIWWQTLAGFIRRAPREHLDILRRDAAYALRLLRRRPGFATSVLLTLGIGIGLNTAVFSVVSGVLLRSLPIPESDRLVRIFEVKSTAPGELDDVSPGNFIDWRAQARRLDRVALIGSASPTLIAGDGDPEQLRAMTVTDGFFDMLGARPALGRLFTPRDFEPIAARLAAPSQTRASSTPGVVILGHELWQRAFGGRSDVIGTSVRLGGHSVEVIGVMPVDFAFTEIPHWGSANCWLPDVADPEMRRARYRTAVGRLAPGASIADAQAEFVGISTRLAAAYPDADKDWSVRLVRLVDSVTIGVRTELWLLFGASACVLLIACVNVANLLLARATGRRLELGTRMALGASYAQLVRQTVTEGLVLGAIGGAGGLLIASVSLPALVALAPGDVPRLHEITIDWRILVFTIGVSLAVGIGCGLVACLSLDQVRLQGAPRPGSAGTSGAGRRMRQGLTVAEIALAMLLVIATGLLVRTVRALGAVDLGYDPHNVIVIDLAPDRLKYGGLPGIAAFQAQLIERIQPLPGVIAVGSGSQPLNGGGPGNAVKTEPHGADVRLDFGAVSPGYLAALGARLVHGRDFQTSDTSTAPPVTIVNQAAARHLWGTEDVVGRSIFTEEGQVPVQVVGVIADVRRAALEAADRPVFYLPALQSTRTGISRLLIRTSDDPKHVVPAVRSILRQLDPEQPLKTLQTLEGRIDEVMAPRRFILRLVGLFSALALGLAVLGIYGVIAESVAQRVPEIGLRMALGATPANVSRMVLSQGIWLAAIGIAIGVGAALTLRQSMATFVFGVPTTDPLAYLLAGVSLAAATMLASSVPARRAASVDPVVALRQE